MSEFEQKPNRADVITDVVSGTHEITEPSGHIFTNRGATEEVTFKLPNLATGKRYSFARLSEDFRLKVIDDNDDEVSLILRKGSKADQARMDEAGCFLTLLCDGNRWFVEFETESITYDELSKLIFLSSGINSAIIAKGENTTYMWGQNTFGACGNDATGNVNSPVSVVGNHNFKNINAAGNVSIALDENGFAWTWGQDSSGALGKNTRNVHASSPVSVIGDHVFKEVTQSGGGTGTGGIDVNGPEKKRRQRQCVEG